MTVPAETSTSPTTVHDIVVAIVTYNNVEHLPALVQSVRLDSSAHRILVVDNASSDDTVATARAMFGVTVVETGGNLGYSGAINIARALLGPNDALAVLNPDLTLAPGALAELRRALRDPKVGIAVPLLRNPDGTVYPHLRLEPSIAGSLGDAVFGAHWLSRPRFMSDTLRRAPDYRVGRDVAWAGGAALMVAPACSSIVGPWDSETYFLYSEETDYERRARDAGFRVRFVPSAEATHVGGGSGQPAELLALMAVNRIRYFQQHHSRFATAAFQTVVVLHHFLRSRDPRHHHAARMAWSRRRWDLLPCGDSRARGNG